MAARIAVLKKKKSKSIQNKNYSDDDVFKFGDALPDGRLTMLQIKLNMISKKQ